MERSVLTYQEFIAESKRWIDTGDKKVRASWYNRSPDETVEDRMRIDDTQKYLILKFIYKSGHQGVRYTDIIKFILEDLKGETYDYKIHRGYYASNLSGTWRDGGILPSYCTKNDNGKWVLSNSKLIDHFNDLKETGALEDTYVERRAREEGMDQSDINMYRELDILDDLIH
jgi:hypothetical protein